ncbi:bifunctional UDP-N-acetylglucosamine diphosphorylase/glucosamine-1-phosphate N-acetyltransferase GlmU [Clostridium cylindrosporum]|uniref:Bifunctional protein GlmU n=1 Tax=Clostridium cylindrosporum DSM 605 TaxID=1121307 RepID=A0A0J8D877_CLOCY|nr:bifunctional UDP-N-acetylglucosamine diphosphorylase/glucosamine-1-phosphate N-acetyltransferase GlmU [Clostridium cylindrosporum]KMT22067.1 bifunctional protein GlmU [Clostridium cylindrosporum DSM 605]
MKACYGLILAAGEGKRMKSKLPKVLHKVCGKSMIDYIIDAVKGANAKDTVVVVGHKADIVKGHLGNKVSTAFQDKQLGTGHAVMCCEEFLKDKDGIVIVLAGDGPLITKETISKVFEYHIESGSSATILTADAIDPTGLGRIVRNENGEIEKIVEHKDATEKEREITEVNSSNYCFEIKELISALRKINNNNAQGEYYLTDVIEILKGEGKKVSAYKTSFKEFMAVNSRDQLATASAAMKERILEKLMADGVTIIDPLSTYIESDVTIGSDTIVYPGAFIEGNTTIGEDCIIGHNTRIVDAKIGNGVEVQSSVIISSEVKDSTKIGPFAYIRPDSVIGENVKIGDFVEIKKSTIGNGTKISHLTYVGDSEVGEGCNFGCGTVTVNYDGKNKYKTIVKDNAFIGCNTNLVAPVTIGENAYTAAGSTITKDVPDGALAIGRSKDVIKKGWVQKRGIKKK